MIRILYMLVLFFIIYLSFKLTHFLLKRFNLNRWLILSTIPFIIVVPILIFSDISNYFWLFLMLLLTVVSVMFFETSRYQIEQRKIKGIVYNPIKNSK